MIRHHTHQKSTPWRIVKSEESLIIKVKTTITTEEQLLKSLQIQTYCNNCWTPYSNNNDYCINCDICNLCNIRFNENGECPKCNNYEGKYD